MTNGKYVERIDALTGCANLLAFLETVSTRLNIPEEASFSLLVIDLNNFIAFNTEHGRKRGDAVLHWISIVLRDTGLPVYRIGGDEFLVWFEEGGFDERMSGQRTAPTGPKMRAAAGAINRIRRRLD